MNENIQENYATVEENVSSNSGVSDNTINSGWNGSSSISAGNSGQAESAYVSGNGDIATLPEVYNSVSNNGTYTGTSDTGESVQYLAQISQGIGTLNSTVTLLFFFLLMAWAEKKINVVVRRFSEKR